MEQNSVPYSLITLLSAPRGNLHAMSDIHWTETAQYFVSTLSRLTTVKILPETQITSTSMTKLAKIYNIRVIAAVIRRYIPLSTRHNPCTRYVTTNPIAITSQRFGPSAYFSRKSSTTRYACAVGTFGELPVYSRAMWAWLGRSFTTYLVSEDVPSAALHVSTTVYQLYNHLCAHEESLFVHITTAYNIHCIRYYDSPYPSVSFLAYWISTRQINIELNAVYMKHLSDYSTFALSFKLPHCQK